MQVPILKIINLALLLLMLVFLSRYAWTLFWGTSYEPPEWEKSRKAGSIPPRLKRCLNAYEDKIRFFTLWLQIERLKIEKIPGAFAELGVYKGESARLMHYMDPDRELHLFDTFNGLPESDLIHETGEAATYSNRNFKDTEADKTLRYINGDKQKLIIHQGYFPETAVGLENTLFAFVSLDADLYNPTLAGLNFFYPRLSPGGAILIHDYNFKWEGLMKAVDEFCTTIPEVPVKIPDLNSSVMIVKSRYLFHED